MSRRVISLFNSLAPFVILLAAVAFLVVAGDSIGFDADTSNVFITMLPSIGALVIGGWVISSSDEWVFIPAGFFAIGCGLALMTGSMNDLGVLIPEMIAQDITLGELQGIIISMVTVVGAILGALFRRV